MTLSFFVHIDPDRQAGLNTEIGYRDDKTGTVASSIKFDLATFVKWLPGLLRLESLMTPAGNFYVDAGFSLDKSRLDADADELKSVSKPLETIVRDMVNLVEDVPDEEDQNDLRTLLQQLESSADLIRAKLKADS